MAAVVVVVVVVVSIVQTNYLVAGLDRDCHALLAPQSKAGERREGKRGKEGNYDRREAHEIEARVFRPHRVAFYWRVVGRKGRVG